MAQAREQLAVRQRSEPAPKVSRGDLMQEALAECLSGRLVYVDPTTFALKREYALVNDEQSKKIDLSQYHLPESPLISACSLAEDRTLAIATVLAVDSHLLNAGANKDTHRSVANLVSTLAKLWEWGRLRGLYRPADWKESHFRALAKSLGKSRWTGGMQLDRRVQELLWTRPTASLFVRFDSEASVSLREGLASLLHTNLSVQELGSVRKTLFEYAGVTDRLEPWVNRRPTVSWMVQTLRGINELVRVPKKFGFTFAPYPDPYTRAKKLAVPNKRTRTMTVEQAVGLLVHSYDWVQNKANAAVAMVAEVGRIAQQLGTESLGHNLRARLADEMWRRSTVRIEAEATLGFPVEMVKVNENAHGDTASVAHVVEGLMSSAFVLIAGLNARRKDEICHRKLGLTRHSMRVINEELGVYQGDFYLMKTLQDYAPYFVNRTTYDAFVVLSKLEIVQQNVEAMLLPASDIPDSSHSLFWRRTYSVTRGQLGDRIWYQFQMGRSGAGSRFLRDALGDGASMQGTSAHMFRRFYAIIYFYRFEHASLIHLRYQLAQLNLDCTQQYVSDAVIGLATGRIPASIKKQPQEVRAAMQSDLRDLAEEIKAVGSEKLYESIKGLVGGAPASGGFPALLLRLQRRLTAAVDYSRLDKDAQTKRLAAVVERRGHAIRPLPHGDCLAGRSAARSAKCAEGPGSGPAPENASADVCSRCSLHWVSEGHLQGQKMDLEMLDREIATQAVGTVQSNQRVRLRENLQKAIWLHEARMN